MNLSIVSAAVEAYKDGASDADKARLDFFEGLFALQQQRADDEAANLTYVPLGKDAADDAYFAFEPLLAKAPAAIDGTRFFGTCKRISEYLADNAALDDDVAEALRTLDWYKLVAAFDLDLAGRAPAGFVEHCLKEFDSFGIGPDVPASLVMMVVSFALRAHLQPVAERLYGEVSRDVKESHQHERPLNCPVCGCPAVASHVAVASGIDGRDRQQYCSMCGTSWPFERMRCGVCGTENASRLHYFHVEGDSTHRLQNCDECGQYQRMVFQEDLSIPLSMEVEDVVMAKLDAIALDPRFRVE